jgi:hypothetical protein
MISWLKRMLLHKVTQSHTKNSRSFTKNLFEEIMDLKGFKK